MRKLKMIGTAIVITLLILVYIMVVVGIGVVIVSGILFALEALNIHFPHFIVTIISYVVGAVLSGLSLMVFDYWLSKY